MLSWFQAMNENPDSALQGGLTEDDVSEMVRRLAHEIRNPLATIKSGVQLIQRLTNPNDDILRYFRSVLNQIDRIDRTVSDIHRLSRLTPGSPEAFSVATSVERVVEELKEDANRNHQRLEVKGDTTLRAYADVSNVYTALRELLLNAIRFSPVASLTTIEWSRLGEREVVIHVSDQGPGIPMERKDQILRPFFSTSTQGTGVGLNITDKLSRMMGGRLVWQNLPERGCRFSLILPGV